MEQLRLLYYNDYNEANNCKLRVNFEEQIGKMRIAFIWRGWEGLSTEILQGICLSEGHETRAFIDVGVDTFLQSYGKFTKWLNAHEQLIKEVVAYKPDLVCSSVFTTTWPIISSHLSKLRKLIDVPVLIGGVGAILTPEEIIKDPNVDMLCAGEGEDVMRTVCRRLANGENFENIEGLWVKKNGHIIRPNSVPPLVDLDSLPFPYKDDFFKAGAFKKVLRVFSGRGCPYFCTFCANDAICRNISQNKALYVRKHSPQYVIEMLRYFIKKYPVKKVFFWDACFNSDKNFLLEFLPKYKAEISLPFYAPLSIKGVDKEIATLLGKSGCEEVLVGLESGDEDFRLNVYKKRATDKEYIEGVKGLQEAGVRVTISVIFGSPGETPVNFSRTFQMIDKLNPDHLTTFTFFPQPHTPLTTQALMEGLIKPADMYKPNLYHDHYVLKQPYSNIAQNFNNLAPLYFLSPKSIKPLIHKWALSGKPLWLTKFLFKLTLPLTTLVLGFIDLHDVTFTIIKTNFKRLLTKKQNKPKRKLS